ncbi:MAG TPA: PAS domain S-box protein, partial [Candidatus Edwardsbacteria bacterium]|nr:PAS domain S-box protein [Candidatus Edwardsbacteria bacterium]
LGRALRRSSADLLLADAGSADGLPGLRDGRLAVGRLLLPLLLAVSGERRPAPRRAAGIVPVQFRYPCAKRDLVMAVERALWSESADLYRVHFQNVSDIVYTIGRGPVVTSVSPSITAVLGYEPGELVGRRLDVTRYVGRPLAGKVRRALGQALRGRPAGAMVIDVRAKDGGRRTLEIRFGRTVATAAGPVVTGTARDITDWKNLTASLQDSEQRYRLLTDTSPDMIFVVGPGGIVEYVNAAAARAVGKPFDKLVGRRIGELFPAPTARRQLANVRRVYATGRPLSLENRSVIHGRTLWLDTRLVPVRDPRGRVSSVMGVSRDITGRKRAEQALRESEEKYRTLFSQASDGIMLMATDGPRFTVNRSFARMHGYRSPAEMERLRLGDLDTPETARLAAQRLRRMLAGETLHFEVEHYHRDGHAFPLRVSCSVVRIGGRSYFLGFHRDITEHKRAEQALQRSERQYRSTIDSMGDAINVVDRRLRFVLVNRRFQAWCRELGLPPLAAGQTIFQAFPFLPRSLRREYAAVFRSGRTMVTEETSAVAGRAIATETRKIPIVEHGRVVRVITIVRDITQRQRTEQALRESEEKYRGLVEATDTGFVILDARGRVLDANAEYVRLTGRRTLAQVRGRPVTDWTAPYDLRRNRSEVAKCMRQGSVRSLEIDYRHPDGAIVPIEVNATVIRTAAGPQIVTLCRDITARKRTEQALRENLAKYQLLFNSINDSVWIQESGRHGPGRIIEVNKKACQRLGYTREQMLGMTIADIDAPEQVARIKQTFRRIQRLGHLVFEADHLTRQGRRVSMELSVSRIRYQGRDAQFVVGRDITERKRAERALRESEQINSAISGLTTDYSFIVDIGPRGRMALRWTSENMRQATGRTLTEAATPALWRRIIHPADLAAFSAFVRRTVAGGAAADLECRSLTKAGAERWVQVFVQPVRGGGGLVAAVIGAVKDITERKRAEQALRESEQNYRTIFNGVNEGIYRSTPDGKPLLNNPALIRMLGFANEAESLRRDIASEGYYDPAVREQYKRRMERDGKVRDFINTWRRKDGTPLIVRENAHAVRDASGRIKYYEGTVEDITERWRAEQALRDSEERFRSFIEQAAEGIVILDEQGRIVEWNRAQQRIYGPSRDQAIGRYFWDLQYQLTPRGKRTAGQRQYFRRLVQRALRTGRSPIFDKPSIVRVDGPAGTERLTEQRAFPIRTEHGFRIGAVTLDVTEQRRLEQQVLEVGDQVQRQIGHDLHDGVSQLLTVIALRMKALQQRLAARRIAESGEAATVAEMIRRTMTEVIGLSRGLSPISLERGGIVLALRELAQNTATIGVPCRARIDETVRVADLAVATHLYRIAQEAVHNAIKHARAARIDLTLRRERGGLLLEVADDGRGLPPAGAPTAGMGLSLMRYRAGMIGAVLELERNRAGGTTVRCRYGAAKPLHNEDAQ